MIRFIDLGKQLPEYRTCFAFYDTVSGEFVNHSGSEVWETVEEFEDDFSGTRAYKERFMTQIPANFKSLK